MVVHRAAKMALIPGFQSKKNRADAEAAEEERLNAAMPDPAPLIPAIATMVIEVVSGTRSVDQLSNLVSDQVYERLRSKIIARKVAAGNTRPPLMPKFAVGKVRTDSPKPGVFESVVLVTTESRTRAVAIRMEPVHHKWRATSVSIL